MSLQASAQCPVSQRLSQLRGAMSALQLDAYIVTNNDPHASEYSANHWLARRWITGFTGSAGDAVITPDGGGLWTDGRYYIQAEEELQGSGLSLFKARLAETPSIPEWLAQTLPANSRVGVDGRTVSYAFYQQLQTAFADKKIDIVLEHDLIDGIWHDRPARPTTPVFCHPLQYAGLTTAQKLAQIRQYMAGDQVDDLLISTLDDVMWTLNIRGGDTPYCPISESYLLISAQAATLFIDPQKLPEAVQSKLEAQGVNYQPYGQISNALSQLPAGHHFRSCARHGDARLISSLPADLTVSHQRSYVTDMKATKNPTELENMEETLRLDGIAMVKFMSWLEQQVPGGDVTELSAEQQLQHFRTLAPTYLGDSFRTIAAFAEHGAKMHYAADEDSNVLVDESNFFLVDSGGQYLGGTTDITRTFSFGTLSQQQRIDYTLVLKAVIRLSQARFLKGSTGSNLDVLARGVLWQQGIDYKCGTGHGVGMCLNVHEGPQNFSQSPTEVELKPNMVITNEPGVYREGEYGVRIENIMKVVEIEQNEFGVFYGFDTITLAPIATQPLEAALLDASERQWLNDYHAKVFTALEGGLTPEERAWLQRATAAV
ncbi:aminopeptidase P family protein [Photobacterium sp. MCCC 1A19761]|uniref:aminopeptidase P family protein n=1 Tax=Photobacterium sp. MCCC 1A19761 TaxID=3115000 RepID=UPI00307F60A0